MARPWLVSGALVLGLTGAALVQRDRGPCAVLDLGDVVLCAQHVVGVERDVLGGAVIETAHAGVRIAYATVRSVPDVRRALEGVR